MPAQTVKRRTGLKGRSPRAGLPEPGIGGYDYPAGPYGATGFPGSTAAGPVTHTQMPPEGARGTRQLTPGGNQDEWARLPARRPGGDPSQPTARTGRETRGERRMSPVIGGAPGSQNVRNTYAQRYKAVPGQWRGYRPAPNPGKTGATLMGASQFHPDATSYGNPDGKPVPGMPSQPGYPEVEVCSRFVSEHGSNDGYAMNRDLAFDKGGVAAFPEQYEGVRHLRGGRLTGQRYFGALEQQQKIGLESDAFGIARARGPRHRPLRFEVPPPRTANYYDVPPDEGTSAPDMIHRSPGQSHRSHRTTGKPPRRKGKPRRG